MTGKVIERGAASTLILILPLAFAIVFLYKAWPFLLVLFALSLVWKIWRFYEWKRWDAEISPYFHRLIRENQGCLTATDLAITANLRGDAAKRFLEKKAEEYGAQQKHYEDKGTIYYFLTSTALGTIFDDSEPTTLEEEDDDEEILAPTVTAEAVETPLEKSAQQDESQTDSLDSHQDETEVTSSEIDKAEEEEEEEVTSSAVDEENEDNHVLIQLELAKRLDVNSSTVGRRKGDADFAEWSQSRDPDEIAWQYSDEERVFTPVEEI